MQGLVAIGRPGSKPITARARLAQAPPPLVERLSGKWMLRRAFRDGAAGGAIRSRAASAAVLPHGGRLLAARAALIIM